MTIYWKSIDYNLCDIVVKSPYVPKRSADDDNIIEKLLEIKMKRKIIFHECQSYEYL